MSTHTAQALWPHRPNHLHPLHTHELTHKHKHTCSERLRGSTLPSWCPQSLVDRDWQGCTMTSSSQTNPNALRSVGRAHMSAWGLPCRSQSPVLPQTYTHWERMTPAGQWGREITITVQSSTALCGLIILRVPCSARISVEEGAVSLRPFF